MSVAGKTLFDDSSRPPSHKNVPIDLNHQVVVRKKLPHTLFITSFVLRLRVSTIAITWYIFYGTLGTREEVEVSRHSLASHRLAGGRLGERATWLVSVSRSWLRLGGGG